jgi:hypothetical protein
MQNILISYKYWNYPFHHKSCGEFAICGDKDYGLGLCELTPIPPLLEREGD